MRAMNITASVLLAMLIGLLGSCTKDSGPIIVRPPMDTLSFNDTILPILLDKCNGCHPGYASLDLDPEDAYESLVAVPTINYRPFERVDPFEPEMSALYQKVSGNSEFGNQMPLYEDPLTEAEVWLIYDWIAQGAMNN